MNERTREELDHLCNEYAQETLDIVDAIKAFLEAFEVEYHKPSDSFEIPLHGAIRVIRSFMEPERHTALARLWEIVKDVQE